VVPALRGYVSIQPRAISSVLTGDTVQITITSNAAIDAPIGLIKGTVHLRKGKKTLSKPIEINLEVREPDEQIIPESILLPSYDRIHVDTYMQQAFVKDEVLIEMRQTATLDELRSLVLSIEGQFIGSIPGLNIYQIRVPGYDELSIQQLVNLFKDSPSVRSVARHWFVDTYSTYPDDSLFSPWGQGPSDRKYTWAQEYIGLPLAWSYVRESDQFPIASAEEVKIAVIDNYFKSDHRDLSDNVETATGESRAFSFDYLAPNTGHGTHVAGIIGATGNNKIGIAGVLWDVDLFLYVTGYSLDFRLAEDWDWQDFSDWAEIEPMLDLSGSKVSIPKVLDYAEQAAKAKVKIINYSADFPSVSSGDGGCEQIASFLQKWREEIVFVNSVGNQGKLLEKDKSCVDKLSSLENFISVAAIGVNSSAHVPALWSSSNRGDAVSVAAPGERILSSYVNPIWDGFGITVIEEGGVFKKDYYTYMSGTSQAAPFVSGVSGLLISYDSSLKAPDVKRLIVEGSKCGAKRVHRYESENQSWIPEKYFALDALESLRLLEEDYVGAAFLEQFPDIFMDQGESRKINVSFNRASADVVVSNASGEELPNWIEYDQGELIVHPPIDYEGTIKLKLDLVINGCAVADSRTFFMMVNDVNEVPRFVSEPLVSVVVGSQYEYLILVEDPDGDKTSITAKTAPNWVTFRDEGNGVAYLTGTPSNEAIGTIDNAVLLEVSDGVNETTQAFEIDVQEDPGDPNPPPFPDLLIGQLWFEDPQLTACVLEQAFLQGAERVSHLRILECPSRGIRSLFGIEQLWALNSLNLSMNEIEEAPWFLRSGAKITSRDYLSLQSLAGCRV